MSAQNNQKGFTIIEVVLVLAIAALIFLMIFIALPALQRGQRDTARKQDVGTVASAINTYRSNHRGALPTASGDLDDYIDNLSQVDPATIDISTGTGSVGKTIDIIKVFGKATCKDDNTVTGGSSRQAAVVTLLENGGTEGYCQSV